jgi:serine/threonine protein kinase
MSVRPPQHPPGQQDTESLLDSVTRLMDGSEPDAHGATAPVHETGEPEEPKEEAPTRLDFPAQPGDILEAKYRYRLIRPLGRGGFGSVFLADSLDGHNGQSGPPAQVAIKVIGSTNDRQARTSLKRELSALLAIRHDRIPKLYDWSLDGEQAFVALQYFPAGSLADARPFMGRFDEAQTWRLITDLMSALSAAHWASVLHLDVKPSNVLLDGNGGFVLTDFGVSHSSRMSKGLLHQGQIAVGLGTHGYRAPEQDSCTIQSFDLRTDLWGVGATAWSLYTGIDLNKRQDVLRRKESGNVFGLQRLSDVALRCPPPLEEVIMGLLYIDPTQRPGGASEVLTQIKAIASGFGLDSDTMLNAHRQHADPGEIRSLIDSLVDPLWASICRSPGFDRFFARFEDGEVLSGQNDRAHHTLLLLTGRVRVERDDRLVDIETREGSLLGAISTLTGAPRRVTLRADGPVWVCIFNEAELEQLVTCNPAVAVRLIRNMAGRIAAGPDRHGG